MWSEIAEAFMNSFCAKLRLRLGNFVQTSYYGSYASIRNNLVCRFG